MKSSSTTVEEYCAQVPLDKKEAFDRLRKTILDHLPVGFVESMNYGMIGYVVPHSLYPAGYHCDPKLPIPFMGLAYQKHSINMYHMGLYADLGLLEWFQTSYKQIVPTKLDMGKSCIRFRHYEQIPYELISELIEKISANERIEVYEKTWKK